MQEFQKGLIVRTISGHDKNMVYLVCDVIGSTVLLVNGKNRPIDNPKKKNVKHIIKVGLSNELLDLMNNNKLDNSMIIRLLKKYN
ncbi:MAG: KOW domain-containing protein [Clostridiales bacterium]|nr:KOW domain-containing protein [Clostridiales bacterium]